ncbi:MAG: hypothetical protein JW801_09120 [Bacteroidales bacterium]|nr:hypothetical protein [Bacteroidales bacterium]
MKPGKKIAFLILSGLMIMFQSCTEGFLHRVEKEEGILPARFKIDIPASISSEDNTSLKSASSISIDTLKGRIIYAHLNRFVAIGERAADMVQDILLSISAYDINEAMTLSFIGDRDGRVKNLEVTEGVEYAGVGYEFRLTITDADSEAEADGGRALQVFWDRDPIRGVAIVKPYNSDREAFYESPEAVFRIVYSEEGEDEYESFMTVEIAGMPVPRLDNYALRSLKMFVGKKNNRVDVYGNSDHPNASFFTDYQGFNWSFVASGYTDENIAVAEVGLPPCGLDESSRDVLLGYYSIKNVLIQEITLWFLDLFGITPDTDVLERYLQNSDAPGFFNANGFIQGGISPGSQYDILQEQVNFLRPYNPKDINELVIHFQ